jgi:hypothetical protein
MTMRMRIREKKKKKKITVVCIMNDLKERPRSLLGSARIFEVSSASV